MERRTALLRHQNSHILPTVLKTTPMFRSHRSWTIKVKCATHYNDCEQAAHLMKARDLKWINHWSLDTRPVWSSASQPHSITATWPVTNYTAWWQRNMCVNNLPKVVTWKQNSLEFISPCLNMVNLLTCTCTLLLFSDICTWLLKLGKVKAVMSLNLLESFLFFLPLELSLLCLPVIRQLLAMIFFHHLLVVQLACLVLCSYTDHWIVLYMIPFSSAALLQRTFS